MFAADFCGQGERGILQRIVSQWEHHLVSMIVIQGKSTAGDGKSMESIAKNDNSDPMDDKNDQHKNYAAPRMSHVPMPQREDASTPL